MYLIYLLFTIKTPNISSTSYIVKL